MTYKQALEFIHSIPKFVRPLGNEKLGLLLEKLGNPQDDMKFVHIAGTNGKGSTAAMLSKMLQYDGYKTGMYISPFIEVFNERIQINGENIHDEMLARLTDRVKTAMGEDTVSEFAFITAIAFLYFKEQECDYVVLETGMGGKLDATNIIKKPVVSVLTSISLDHMQFLGDTIEEIAIEKCGIIKENCPTVSYSNYEVKSIIEEYAKSKSSRLVFAKIPEITSNGFTYKGKKYKLALKGEYQPKNAAVAIETAYVLGVFQSSIEKGLENVYWPARFEYISENIIIDGGHNIDGIKELKKSLLSLDKEVVLLVCMMEDKSYKDCIDELREVSDTIITTQLDIPRCLGAKELAGCCNGIAVEKPKEALKKAIELAGDDKLVCVCGSLYLAGEIKRLIKL